MSKTAKGRIAHEPVIDIDEAAKLLGLTRDGVKHLVRREILRPARAAVHAPGANGLGGPKQYFSLYDVTAYAETRAAGRAMPIRESRDWAMKAYVISRGNERRLQDLMEYLGMCCPVLSVTETEVVSLYAQAEGVSISRNGLTPQELREWAGIFYSIDEAYLELVEKYTASDEPWKAFLDAGDFLADHIRNRGLYCEPALQAAATYFEISRRNLRAAAYLYCTKRHSKELANRVFEQKPEDITAEIVGFLLYR